MKTPAAVCALLLVAGEAHAISRYVSTSMTCAQVTAKIDQQGAAILQHRSPRTGNLLYDRYVRNRLFCQPSETTDWASVPTKDNAHCPVYRCKQIEFLDMR